MSQRPPAPFTYRLEYRREGRIRSLDRAPDYPVALDLMRDWASQLEADGEPGSIVIVEEAFGTMVARHGLGAVRDFGHRENREAAD